MSNFFDTVNWQSVAAFFGVLVLIFGALLSAVLTLYHDRRKVWAEEMSRLEQQIKEHSDSDAKQFAEMGARQQEIGDSIRNVREILDLQANQLMENNRTMHQSFDTLYKVVIEERRK
jgi:hypothetical protein